MAPTTEIGIFSTLRPFGLPATPILSVILTQFLNTVYTPRQYVGITRDNNNDPATLLHNIETQGEKGSSNISPELYKKIVRSKAATANLLENMPIYLAASLVAWIAGVKPEYQNAYHAPWVVSRSVYKWAYLNGKGEVRTICYMASMIATITMLIHGGNLLALKY